VKGETMTTTVCGQMYKAVFPWWVSGHGV